MAASRNFLRSAALALFLLPGLAAGGARIAVAEQAIQFATEQLVVHARDGARTFTVELALSDPQREHGLMFRKAMPADHGMLFDFGATRRVLMWMKNTPLPLDMLFLDKAGTIVSIRQGAVPYSETIIDSEQPVKYVIEINGGIVAKLGLAVGDKVASPTIARGR